ncbi:hypothetical protein [Pseudotabrizicola algicola]|uniref:Uncharacterized protein n=1 Tax=Pseudotabrizicola algicola TaxID=2709381 RepID=A0A6B3RX31_9RHOB|nr:hypothetical protein [Pseudotabrizicola algicola]NEX47629.1 hypothetical protein [Pseudotabrizicola algicola]
MGRPVRPIVPMAPQEMVERAARAVGRVLRDDMRGITGLSIDDITAMTGTLIALGLVPVLPGEATPDTLIERTRT